MATIVIPSAGLMGAAFSTPLADSGAIMHNLATSIFAQGFVGDGLSGQSDGQRKHTYKGRLPNVSPT